MKKPSLIVLCLSSAWVGCGKAPAGFWTQFPDGQLTQNIGQQGGRGGWRALHFTSRAGETLIARKIQSFAAENGWKFVSEEMVSTDRMKAWVDDKGKRIFPLGYDGFAPGKNDSVYDRFPRWILTNATLLTFDSGWITAIGGVEKTANGFALLADDGKSLSIYHLWGE